MKKFLVLILILVITPLIGGIYGILHDQLTYTISPEYYTKFKFYQFGLMDMGSEAIFPNPRIQVAVVGFMATWWVGLPIGIILGLVGLIHQNSQQMFRVTMKAMALAIGVTFITGLVGLTYGKLYLADLGVSWSLPDNLIDPKNFIAIGSMHNFSYLGGLFGLIAGIFFSIDQKRKLKKQPPIKSLLRTPAINQQHVEQSEKAKLDHLTKHNTIVPSTITINPPLKT